MTNICQDFFHIYKCCFKNYFMERKLSQNVCFVEIFGKCFKEPVIWKFISSAKEGNIFRAKARNCSYSTNISPNKKFGNIQRRWTWTGDFKCREVKTGFYRNRSMQTGSSGTLIGWKSGQTTFVPLWDWMEEAWLRTLYSNLISFVIYHLFYIF